MNHCTEAERYMLEGIRRGSGDAWSQVVDRYQGRLVAYARRRAPRGVDAEDVVQDTFLRFVRGLNSFREESSLETFLFVILKRTLADAHRGRRMVTSDLPEQEAPPAPDLTASRYARREEQRDAAREVLSEALNRLVGRMQESLNFRDLQIIEMLFSAQRSNMLIAQQMGVDANHVALLKHRWIKELREFIAGRIEKIPWEDGEAMESLLTETWGDLRPSCPKRSTIGSYLLGTLDEPWQQFIGFHINTLGCSFCRANLDDLQQQAEQDRGSLRQKIMESTIGFFR
jgi:RNA polymerase sigma factor (sigma-70 family)